jgi:ribosomal protein L11 methyltransferase
MTETWIEIAVVTSQAAAEVIANRLMELGSQGTVSEDHPDDPNACTIKAYYPQSINESNVLEHIRQYLAELQQLGDDIGSGDISSKSLEPTDWSSDWKQYFKPFRVGNHLVIKPSWEPFDTRDTDLVIEIDPGMAFGTGLHASTRLALRLLERYVHPGDHVLDVGAGSGVLGITAARLGADYVLGVDTDAEALAIARENVRRNALERDPAHPDQPHIELLVGSIDTIPIAGKFDCVVMNIRSNVIVQLMPYVKSLLQTGGAMIISGILEAEGAELIHVLRSFDLRVQDHLVEEDWIAYVLSEEC